MHVDLGIGGVEAYVLSAAIALPLCFRRRYPIPVMLAVAVLFVVNGERATFAFSREPGHPVDACSWRSTPRSPGPGTGA